MNNNVELAPLKKFRLTGSTTTSGGCTISYDLTVDVSIIPPKFNGLSGTLTFSGNCSGQQTITIVGKGTVNSSYVFTDFYIENSPFEFLNLEIHMEAHLLEMLNVHSGEIFEY